MFNEQEKYQQYWKLIEPRIINPDNTKLRRCQWEAIFGRQGLISKLENKDKNISIEKGGKPKIFSITTGAGKSILILLTYLYLAQHLEKKLRPYDKKQIRALIVTPNLNLKKGNFEALEDALKLDIIPKEVYMNIKRTMLQHSKADLKLSDYVVINYQALGKESCDRILKFLDKDDIDILLIDEAHHAWDNGQEESTTHQDILEKFNTCYKLFYTATPFQGLVKKDKDGKYLVPPLFKNQSEKDIIFEYNYNDALKDGVAKYLHQLIYKPKLHTYTDENLMTGEIKTIQVEGEELSKLYKNNKYKKVIETGEETVYDLLLFTESMLKQKEEQIPGKHHAALVVFKEQVDAKRAGKIAEKRGLNHKFVVVIGDKDQYEKIDKIKKDYYGIILSCNIFNEGFDYKNFTILTFSRNISKGGFLNWIQLVGRIIRERKCFGIEPSKDIAYIIAHESNEKCIEFFKLYQEMMWETKDTDCQHNWIQLLSEESEYYLCGKKCTKCGIKKFQHFWENEICKVCGKRKIPPPISIHEYNIKEQIPEDIITEGYKKGILLDTDTKVDIIRKKALEEEGIDIYLQLPEQKWKKYFQQLQREGIVEELSKGKRITIKHEKERITEKKIITINDNDNKDVGEIIQNHVIRTQKILKSYVGTWIKKEKRDFQTIMKECYNIWGKKFGYRLLGKDKKYYIQDEEHRLWALNELPKILETFTYSRFKELFEPELNKFIEKK